MFRGIFVLVLLCKVPAHGDLRDSRFTIIDEVLQLNIQFRRGGRVKYILDLGVIEGLPVLDIGATEQMIIYSTTYLVLVMQVLDQGIQHLHR